MSVDAVAGLRLTGRVTSVGLVPDSDSGSAVTYPVTITLDEGARRARAGMTAGVRIVTANASGVVVPSQALSGPTVTLVKDGTRTVARVSLGLAGDERTVVESGLSAGDQVVETSASAMAGANATPQSSTATTNGRFPGGGRFPGAGGFAGGGRFPGGGLPSGRP